VAVFSRSRVPRSEQDPHQGYVAGRYRDGSLSDDWTEARRCADRTFVRYVARCTCGWIGLDDAPDERGAERCERDWRADHQPLASAVATALNQPTAAPMRAGRVGRP